MALRYALITCFLLFGVRASFAKDIVIVDASKPASEKKALLILPGLGSIMHGVKHVRDYYRDQGYDLYIPDYISRKSVAQCTANVDEFLGKYHLEDYKEVHVLCYIIGAWSFNEWLRTSNLKNLKTVVYDRSPLQERAPYVLAKDIPFLAWIVGGKSIRNMSEIPYPPVQFSDSVKVGLIIETLPTKLIMRHRKSAHSMGDLSWNVADLNQQHTDYVFIPYNHDDLYIEFDGAGKEVLYFFAHGEFSEQGSKEQPLNNPLVP